MAEILAPVQSLIDDALRSHLDALRQMMEEAPGDAALLGSWVLVTDWVDMDGEHWYFRLNSQGMPPHSRIGLLNIGIELED